MKKKCYVRLFSSTFTDVSESDSNGTCNVILFFKWQFRSFCPNLFGHLLKLGCHQPHLEKMLWAALGSPQHLGSVLGTMSKWTGTCFLIYAFMPRHHWDMDDCICMAIYLIQTLFSPNIPQCLLANYKWSVSPKHL